jgi:rhamnose transport system permease protein
MIQRARHELSVVFAIVALALVLAAVAPAYFSGENLRDLFVASVPVLIVALGATLVILTGHADISVGSTFAMCSVLAGVAAKAELPMPAVLVLTCAAGLSIGLMNGALVAYVGLPSIAVTLAMMVGVRDALRWATEGAWVYGLPVEFQWFGLPVSTYPIVAGATAGLLTVGLAWGLRHLSAGRAVYAVGSHREAARLAGLNTSRIICVVFGLAGMLTAVAALLNAVRFNQVPSNGGLGLEMKVIAAVVIGGSSITGGHGRIAGTVLGVILLGMIGPALTYLGISAYWERAIHGAIILTAVAMDGFRSSTPRATSRVRRSLVEAP